MTATLHESPGKEGLQGAFQEARHHPVQAWRAETSQNWPFLFRAYQPRQAQNPTTVMVMPRRRATASPPSNASTVGTRVVRKRQNTANRRRVLLVVAMLIMLDEADEHVT
ncbi:hypothetical protein SRHO_G00003720 [Serrasalmus rhombeus]